MDALTGNIDIALATDIRRLAEITDVQKSRLRRSNAWPLEFGTADGQVDGIYQDHLVVDASTAFWNTVNLQNYTDAFGDTQNAARVRAIYAEVTEDSGAPLWILTEDCPDCPDGGIWFADEWGEEAPWAGHLRIWPGGSLLLVDTADGWLVDASHRNLVFGAAIEGTVDARIVMLTASS